MPGLNWGGRQQTGINGDRAQMPGGGEDTGQTLGVGEEREQTWRWSPAAWKKQVPPHRVSVDPTTSWVGELALGWSHLLKATQPGSGSTGTWPLSASHQSPTEWDSRPRPGSGPKCRLNLTLRASQLCSFLPCPRRRPHPGPQDPVPPKTKFTLHLGPRHMHRRAAHLPRGRTWPAGC